MKPLAPNTMIQNRYLVVHLVGKGGMGEVYLAVDQRLGSAVALKRTYFADDQTLGNAFEREAKILARLRHPVLPKVSDHFMEDGEQYLVMEHISGDDLSKRLEGAQKPFPLSWVMFWADQLLDALTYLHSHEPPIIHRDIKPQNLKLTDENHIVLLDFGLSKDSALVNKSDVAATSGSVVGYTPHFASMEQIRGTGTTAKSDIYSLSATLYQLMTNTVPSDALARADALIGGSADPIIPLSDLNTEIPPLLSDVILKGIEVSQEKRFKTAAEMQKALRRAYTQTREAMSAKTAVFGMSKEPSFKSSDSVPDPSIVPLDSQEKISVQYPAAITESKTLTQPEADDSFDATLKMTPAEAQEMLVQADEMKQADVKTEVLLAGDIPVLPQIKEEPVWSAPVDSPPPSSAIDAGTADDFAASIPDSAGQSGFEHTIAAGAISLGNIDEPANPEFFTSPNIEQKEAAPPPPVDATPKPIPPPAKKSSSKAGLILGGLAGLFLLGLIALGGGWFVYTNYFASAGDASTPTPSPSIEESPSPEPTTDTLADTNSNTDSNVNTDTNTNTDSNSQTTGDDNSNSSVSPTPTPAPTATAVPTATPGAFSTPRPTPVVKSTPVKTPQTPPKATPKPAGTPVIHQ